MLGAEPGASRKAASECSYVLSHLSAPEVLIDMFSAVLCMEHDMLTVPYLLGRSSALGCASWPLPGGLWQAVYC